MYLSESDRVAQGDGAWGGRAYSATGKRGGRNHGVTVSPHGKPREIADEGHLYPNLLRDPPFFGADRTRIGVNQSLDPVVPTFGGYLGWQEEETIELENSRLQKKGKIIVPHLIEAKEHRSHDQPPTMRNAKTPSALAVVHQRVKFVVVFASVSFPFWA
ncbi:Uncharacterized protein Fot_15495 [Forsythia ovata]|uniref:Uncharacterized protein n=1 Tax=Forsythia ovata TaxID=205694 RepID=A0ABD1W9L3_9LAMI